MLGFRLGREEEKWPVRVGLVGEHGWGSPRNYLGYVFKPFTIKTKQANETGLSLHVSWSLPNPKVHLCSWDTPIFLRTTPVSPVLHLFPQDPPCYPRPCLFTRIPLASRESYLFLQEALLLPQDTPVLLQDPSCFSRLLSFRNSGLGPLLSAWNSLPHQGTLCLRWSHC